MAYTLTNHLSVEQLQLLNGSGLDFSILNLLELAAKMERYQGSITVHSPLLACPEVCLTGYEGQGFNQVPLETTPEYLHGFTVDLGPGEPNRVYEFLHRFLSLLHATGKYTGLSEEGYAYSVVSFVQLPGASGFFTIGVDPHQLPLPNGSYQILYWHYDV